MRRVPVVLAVLLLLAATACGRGEPAGGPTADVDLGGGTWVLTAGTVAGEPVTVPEGYRITLTVDGEQLGGRSACNSYGAPVEVDGNRVVIGGLSATDMACEPAVMDAEQRFLTALGRVATASRAGDVLELAGPDLTLTFALQPPVPAEDLVGTTWVLDTLITGEVASSVVGQAATLLLRADGSLRGGTGCRELTGRYVTRGDEVQVTDLAAEGDCSPALRDQDGHVVTVLGDGFRAAVDGRRLTLTSDGGLGLSYLAAGTGSEAPADPG